MCQWAKAGEHQDLPQHHTGSNIDQHTLRVTWTACWPGLLKHHPPPSIVSTKHLHRPVFFVIAVVHRVFRCRHTTWHAIVWLLCVATLTPAVQTHVCCANPVWIDVGQISHCIPWPPSAQCWQFLPWGGHHQARWHYSFLYYWRHACTWHPMWGSGTCTTFSTVVISSWWTGFAQMR